MSPTSYRTAPPRVSAAREGQTRDSVYHARRERQMIRGRARVRFVPAPSLALRPPRHEWILHPRERRAQCRKVSYQQRQHTVLADVLDAEFGVDLFAIVVR